MHGVPQNTLEKQLSIGGQRRFDRSEEDDPIKKLIEHGLTPAPEVLANEANNGSASSAPVSSAPLSNSGVGDPGLQPPVRDEARRRLMAALQLTSGAIGIFAVLAAGETNAVSAIAGGVARGIDSSLGEQDQLFEERQDTYLEALQDLEAAERAEELKVAGEKRRALLTNEENIRREAVAAEIASTSATQRLTRENLADTIRADEIDAAEREERLEEQLGLFADSGRPERWADVYLELNPGFSRDEALEFANREIEKSARRARGSTSRRGGSGGRSTTSSSGVTPAFRRGIVASSPQEIEQEIERIRALQRADRTGVYADGTTAPPVTLATRRTREGQIAYMENALGPAPEREKFDAGDFLDKGPIYDTLAPAANSGQYSPEGLEAASNIWGQFVESGKDPAFLDDLIIRLQNDPDFDDALLEEVFDIWESKGLVGDFD